MGKYFDIWPQLVKYVIIASHWKLLEGNLSKY